MTPKSSTNAGTGRCLSVIFLQLLLCWLTISLPVISQAMRQPEHSKQAPQQPEEDQPVPGSTEEKTVASISLAEEFLHEQAEVYGHFSVNVSKFFIPCQDIYLAFHGELFSPPPDSSC